MNIYDQRRTTAERLAHVRRTLQDPTMPDYAKKEYKALEAEYIAELEKIRKCIVLAENFEKRSKGWTA